MNLLGARTWRETAGFGEKATLCCYACQEEACTVCSEALEGKCFTYEHQQTSQVEAVGQ
jgi:hypothetical protein